MKKLFILIFISTVTFSQTFNNGFNFYLPSTDSSTQKYLPAFPKVPIDNNFVSVSADGKFIVNGKRIRFWGTNSGSDAAFPSKDIAGNMSERLRKFGFNLIRLHHLDNPWSRKSLLDTTSTRHIDEEYRGLLENYISNLKANGIYVNMNLHVSRTFRAADGVADYDSIPEFGKCVNFIDPYIMQLHKEYARQLLTHDNPYTGKPLVNDPVMAMVEITNENSIYRNWRNNELRPIAGGGILPYRYSKMLDSLWIDFLKKKYQSTANLKSTWDEGIIASGKNEQVINGGFESEKLNWDFGVWDTTNASARITIDNSIKYSGNNSARLNISKVNGTSWNIQLMQKNLTVKKDSIYTMTFAAKADRVLDILAAAQKNGEPYNSYGYMNIRLGTEWKIFSFSFRANEENIKNVRVDFDLGGNVGTVWIDDVSLTDASIKGLELEESFESNNIKRLDYVDCAGYSNQRVKDMSEFYITLQRNYFKEMIRYLKNDLGVKVPILTSNWTVGPADLSSMSDADYVDNHAYWDHPQFPNVPWSTTDWLINNTPMVKDQNGGTIPGLFSSVPMSGKPFTVSEYNHPNPNQFQIESVLFTMCYPSFYDADALMYFAYDEPMDWNTDKMSGYFGINRNSIFMSFFPTTAFAFRNGFIKPSTAPSVINYSADTLYSLPKYDGNDWRGASLIKTKNGLVHAVKVGSYFSNQTTGLGVLQSDPVNPFKTDTDEITWNNNDGTIILETEKINGAAGYLSKLKSRSVGKTKVVDFSSSDFGAFTWISLTGEELSISKRSLITLGSKIQNKNMIWDGIKSVHNNWGEASTIIYPLILKLDLNIHADSIKVYPLDNYGKENESNAFILKPTTANQFPVELDQNKYKTLWFGIEKFGEGGSTGIKNEKDIPHEFNLEQNYPNPFNPTTVISYQLPTTSMVSLRVYDILGREILTLVNEIQTPGIYHSTFGIQSSTLPSGIYFYRLQAGEFSQTKKMILLK